MAAVDFITVLGRLLNDGKLRDAFAADAAAFVCQAGLRESDRASLLRLVPTELENQARVLLRKRFDLVRRALPQTCRQIGKDGLAEFERFGRSHPPASTYPLAEDARGFLEHLLAINPAALCRAELNRWRFVHERKRFHLCFPSLTPRGLTKRRALQILLRTPRGHRREWIFYLAV